MRRYFVMLSSAISVAWFLPFFFVSQGKVHRIKASMTNTKMKITQLLSRLGRRLQQLKIKIMLSPTWEEIDFYYVVVIAPSSTVYSGSVAILGTAQDGPWCTVVDGNRLPWSGWLGQPPATFRFGLGYGLSQTNGSSEVQVATHLELRLVVVVVLPVQEA